MLDPTPGRTESHRFPKPVKILSKSNLCAAWKDSRNATSNPGRPGLDGLTAEQFAFRIDERLAALAAELRAGEYHPSRLKPVFIPKPNSSKDRLICIPVIRDRIVQKAILNHLVTKQKLPVENEFSFGFLKGRGTANALDRAVELRRRYDWCLKTDIEAFFDRIPRSEAKWRVSKSLGKSSIKRVGRKQIAKIEKRLEEEYSFENLRKERTNFQQATVDLWRSISSYLSIYRNTYDWTTLDSELRRVGRKVMEGLFEDVFGAGILSRVTPEGREFLGLGTLDIPDGAGDLDAMKDA
ncbi:reverse transcriptase domain-containing protein [Bradyrhizobium genosp. A]|uniref:reverse transcriptase domain-containing protein n=1 Tax=Bradyrhizobium genosp. A TaxID=83626 RepID=UPI003CE8335E